MSPAGLRRSRLAAALAGAVLLAAAGPVPARAGNVFRHGHGAHRVHRHAPPTRHYPAWYQGVRAPQHRARHHRGDAHFSEHRRHHHRDFGTRLYLGHGGYGHQVRVPYHCERCRYSYRAEHDFYDHLHHHHHVALVEIPQVIVHTSFGWIFR